MEREKYIDEISEIINKMEQKAYDSGFKQGERCTKTIMQSALDNEREYGRDEAWEIAKKISKPRSESEWKDFFAFLEVELWHPYDIFMKYTPTEVIEKLEEYEKKKHGCCGKCGECMRQETCPFPDRLESWNRHNKKSCYKCEYFSVNNIYCRDCCNFSKFEERKEQPWYMQIFNQDILDKFTKHMRDATPEERQSVQDYINSISTEVPYNDKGSSIHSEVYKEENNESD